MNDELMVMEEKKGEIELSAEDQVRVKEIAGTIDLVNSTAIMDYGSKAQGNMVTISDSALEKTRTKDLGETGKLITTLIADLKNFDVDESKKGPFGFLKKSANRIEMLKMNYDKAEKNINVIVGKLDEHQKTLRNDITTMDKMYDANLSYFKELTLYIEAGKQKLAEVRNSELVELQNKAQQTGLPEDAQAAKDLAAKCDSFEKKIYDLELSRTVALQTGPQLRMLQASDTVMAEKIQSTIVNTIPLWKNQMVLALGVEHAAQAAKAEKQVNDMTNELLRKNADMLKDASIAAAKESERGIVDIETLQHTNQQLISTLDEVLQIQKDGKEKRAAAEVELQKIEGELKNKLLEVSRN